VRARPDERGIIQSARGFASLGAMEICAVAESRIAVAQGRRVCYLCSLFVSFFDIVDRPFTPMGRGPPKPDLEEAPVNFLYF
jgi:hypothetical protein